jgi:hypothetical protein
MFTVMTGRLCAAATGLVLSAMLAGSSAAAPGPGPTLRILRPGHCFAVGDTFPVSLWMLNLGGTPVAGFQAFLHFDPVKLALVSGSYTGVPFGSPIISPITAASGDIDVAAGINVFAGQPPTTANSLLVTLTFTVLVADPAPSVIFRTHTPPTTLSNPVGAAIAATLVTAAAASSDLNLDGVVNSIDLGILLASWSLPATAPGCGGALACLADLNCDGHVDSLDLGILLARWTL